MKTKTSDQLLVCDRVCDQCLYSDNKIVSDQRKEEILEKLEEKRDFFICHKSSMRGRKVMCRGYYNRHEKTSLLILLGKSLGLLKFVNVLKLKKC